MGRPPTKIVSKYSKTLTIRRSGKIVLRYSQDWAQIPTIYYKKNWNKAKKVEKSRNLSQNEAGVVVWIRSRVDLENNEFENCMHNDSLCLQSGKCSTKMLGIKYHSSYKPKKFIYLNFRQSQLLPWPEFPNYVLMLWIICFFRQNNEIVQEL